MNTLTFTLVLVYILVGIAIVLGLMVIHDGVRSFFDL